MLVGLRRNRSLTATSRVDPRERESIMKKLIIVLAALAACGASTAQTAAAPASKAAPAASPSVPAVLTGEVFKTEAEVLSVDATKRQVTVRMADGQVVSKTLGPEVKNFAQIKAGDRVEATYTRSLRVNFRKGAGVRSTNEMKDSANAAPGAKPGAAAVREVRFVADITEMDMKTGIISVKGASGQTYTAKLTNPAVLKGYAVGDQAEGVFREVAALRVVTPAK